MAAQAIPTARPRRRRSQKIAPYLFLTPALASIALLTAMPIIYTIIVAFTNYNLYTVGGPGNTNLLGTAHWVGLKNFVDLLSPGGAVAELFVPVLIWTVTFAFLTSVLNYALGFVLAVLLNNRRITERAVYRTLLIIPWALPGAISILIWQGLLNQTFGLVDALISLVGLPSVAWLTDPTGAKAGILLVNLWLGFPFNMMIILGGLQAIPGDVYEAASIDGATALQRLRLITFPLVFRITLPVLISAFAFNMTNFNIVYLLTKGQPPSTSGSPFASDAGQTDVLMSFLYNLTVTASRYDKAAALGIIIFLITAVLSFVGFRLSGAFSEVQA